MMNNLPTHIAIAPDGNRRWAEQHGLPKLKGHQVGAATMHSIIDRLIDYEIKYVTLWGFSADNWKRSVDEIGDLFHVVADWIEKDAPWLNSRDVRLRHIGRMEKLPRFLRLAINQAVGLTRDNSGMTLSLALNYGGRAEIVEAVRRLIDNGTPSERVDENLLSRYLYTGGMPDIDLVIRTANELRLSNFMMWQIAYSEFYFTPTLWPDFDTKELEKALEVYGQRQRRFGGN